MLAMRSTQERFVNELDQLKYKQDIIRVCSEANSTNSILLKKDISRFSLKLCYANIMSSLNEQLLHYLSRERNKHIKIVKNIYSLLDRGFFSALSNEEVSSATNCLYVFKEMLTSHFIREYIDYIFYPEEASKEGANFLYKAIFRESINNYKKNFFIPTSDGHYKKNHNDHLCELGDKFTEENIIDDYTDNIHEKVSHLINQLYRLIEFLIGHEYNDVMIIDDDLQKLNREIFINHNPINYCIKHRITSYEEYLNIFDKILSFYYEKYDLAFHAIN